MLQLLQRQPAIPPSQPAEPQRVGLQSCVFSAQGSVLREETFHPIQQPQAEYSEIEKRVLQRVILDPEDNPDANGPLIQTMYVQPMPDQFRMPILDLYDGSTDQDDHLGTYVTKMRLLNYNNVVLCRTFSTTLKGATRLWYDTLRPGTIRSFRQLTQSFLSHVASLSITRCTVPSLFHIKQQPDESLRAFMARFNTTYISIPGINKDVALAAVLYGVQPG
ncbi:hypothetical protein Dimus_039399 [Dionaea muscipula]